MDTQKLYRAIELDSEIKQIESDKLRVDRLLQARKLKISNDEFGNVDLSNYLNKEELQSLSDLLFKSMNRKLKVKRDKFENM